MTSKKRKYGDLSARPLPSDSEHLLDDVFAAFTGPRPEAAQSTTSDASPAAEKPARSAQPEGRPGATRSDSLPPSGGQTTSAPLTTRPVAPMRDFNKRANSLDFDALYHGLFPGTSLKIYNALYVRTRGAVSPTRFVRATKDKISIWSGIKNRKTIDGHMRYFETCGLITRKWEPGNNEGYLFEVFLPEEIGLVGRGGQTTLRPPNPSDRKLERGTDQKLGSGGQSQQIDAPMVYEHPQTSFKTKDEKTDDEPAAFAELRKAERELTGKISSLINWSELDKVLAAELRIAAGRTTVSSVPAFLAEHLRRRLWKLDKKQAQAEGRELPDQNTAAGSSQPRPDCPDCGGSGWWYPDGPERGVMKCAHKNAPQTHPSDASRCPTA